MVSVNMYAVLVKVHLKAQYKQMVSFQMPGTAGGTQGYMSVVKMTGRKISIENVYVK